MKAWLGMAISPVAWVGGLGNLSMVVSIGFAAAPVHAGDDSVTEIPVEKHERAVLREPDHLVPIDPDPGAWHVRYTSALRKQLNLDSFFFARMVRMPSFEGESSLRLHGKEGRHEIDATKEFIVTTYTSDTSIWCSMPEHNEEKRQKDVIVSVRSAPIPRSFAIRLISLWDQMVLRTRAREQPNTGLDGVTIEFATRRGAGKTWCPRQRNSPRLLEELGWALTRYCEAAPARRSELIKTMESQTAILERYLDEHPVK